MTLTSRTARRLGAASAAVCAMMAAPAIALAAPVSAARPAAPALAARHAASAIPPCQTPGLVEWLNTNGSGAAGSTFYKMYFTNLSGRACTLNGFPFLYAVGLAGHQVGRRASFMHHPRPRLVVIGNGKTATALLQIVDVLNYSPSLCHPVWAAGLKVFPPNQTRAKIIPFPFRACASIKAPFLSVGAVR